MWRKLLLFEHIQCNDCISLFLNHELFLLYQVLVELQSELAVVD
jgi:hypothetical protein